MPAAIEAQRARTGLPHWVIVDEAQEPLGRDGAARAFMEPATTGYCLVTYQPEGLSPEALLAVDVLIALPGGQNLEPTVRLLAAAGAMPKAAARQLVSQAGPDHAILVDRTRPGNGLVFAIAERDTNHLRHWHKYSTGKPAWERRFYFRTDWDTPTGRTAGSIEELERELQRCSEGVISHHSNHGDLSHWIAEVLGDLPIAAQVSEIEAATRAGTTSPAAARQGLKHVIRQRRPVQ